VGLGYIQTWQLNHNGLHQEFISGDSPVFGIDGFLSGSAPIPTLNWLGKRFDSSNHVGINVFRGQTEEYEKYRFKTSLNKGLYDNSLDVFRLDYNHPQNPFWVRPVVDELMQVGNGEYLGKMHYRLIPGFPFTLTFFRLRKT
jgi:hypothetical protein